MTGCQSTEGGNALAPGQAWAAWCAGHHDPRGAREDIEKLTDEQLAQAVATLELGRKHCGWPK